MEASYRSSPFFADLDMSNLPPPPKDIPPRPPAPKPVRRAPPLRRTYAVRDVSAPWREEHSPSAKKESD